MKNEYIFIDIAEVWQCVDCGAYAKLKEEVIHYDSCCIGESKKWEQEEKNDD